MSDTTSKQQQSPTSQDKAPLDDSSTVESTTSTEDSSKAMKETPTSPDPNKSDSTDQVNSSKSDSNDESSNNEDTAAPPPPSSSTPSTPSPSANVTNNANESPSSKEESSNNSSSPCSVKASDANSTADGTTNTTSKQGADDSTSDSVDVEETTESPSLSDDSCLQKLLDQGLEDRLAHRLCHLFSSNKLTISDLDDRALAALKDYGSVDKAICILDEFANSDLEHVTNKSAFLCCLMKTHRQKEKQLASQGISTDSSSSRGDAANGATTSTTVNNVAGNNSVPGPDEARLQVILDRTGYSLDVTSGQRKYGGPPPGGDEHPGPGCEIFVGKIPKEMFEDELIPIFEEVGKIWDLRLMIDPITGYSRGFAFITYCNKEDANTAQQKFDGYQVKDGKTLKVNVSVPNLRLFVGNIPKSKSQEEIFAEFSNLTAGLSGVIVYTCPDDRRKNRGFCFLEYDSHKSASQAKRKLTTLRSKVWQCDILVDWADPQEEPDQETMSKVKVLYVRNLVSEVTESELKQLFTKFGTVERVKKIKDYAFVHFQDRNQAISAMEELNDSELHGVKISVSLAKPPSDRKKKEEMLRNRERRVNLMLQQKAMVLGPGIPPGAPVLPSLPPPHLPPPAPHHQLHQVPSGANRLGKQGRNVPNIPPVPGLPTQGPFGHRPYQLAATNYYDPYIYNYYAGSWGCYDLRGPPGPQPGPYPMSNAGSGGRHGHHSTPGPSNSGHSSGATASGGNVGNANSNTSGGSNGRNNRSLWTPNGVSNGATHSINGPSNGGGEKGHKNWNRNRGKNAAKTGDSAGNS